MCSGRAVTMSLKVLYPSKDASKVEAIKAEAIKAECAFLQRYLNHLNILTSST